MAERWNWMVCRFIGHKDEYAVLGSAVVHGCGRCHKVLGGPGR